MLENNPLEAEVRDRLKKVVEEFFSKNHREKCYLGLMFQQGTRQMIQINVPAHDLPILLQAKPSTGNDPESGKNRPEIKGHAEEIKKYLLKRVNRNKPWILGTLTANVDPSKIKLIELTRSLCFVIIPRGVKLDITDGQHRKRAIHELIESEQGELIGDDDFPITLVLESNFSQCQIDFRDMAQARRLDKSLLLSFGEFEGRIGITKVLVAKVPMFAEKTEKVKDSPNKKQKLIYTHNYIARAVSCTFGGAPDRELLGYDIDALSSALVDCLNQFFEECADTQYIFETSVAELSVAELTEFQENCILGRSVGLEVLGHLLNHIYDEDNNYFSPEKISQLAQIDWSKQSSLWEGNIVLNSPDRRSGKPYKMISNSSAVKEAVRKAKLQLGWLE